MFENFIMKLISTELLIVVIHLLAAIICAAYLLLGKSYIKREHIVPIFLVPVAGPVFALVVEWLNFSGKQGNQELKMFPEYLDGDILWKSLKSFSEDENIVPLEEAMLVNDFTTRRRIMLDALYDDPMKYLEVLLIARHNDDIETTHYATTMISHAEKKFQISLQKYAAEIERDPENMNLLNEYIETLEKYIESDLLEEHLLKNQRINYSKLLDRKLKIVPNEKQTLVKKLRNSIELNDYFSAFEVSQQLKQNWPEDEQTWVEAIRVCVEGKDQKKLEETIDEVKRIKINWTRRGREEATRWLGETLI